MQHILRSVRSRSLCVVEVLTKTGSRIQFIGIFTVCCAIIEYTMPRWARCICNLKNRLFFLVVYSTNCGISKTATCRRAARHHISGSGGGGSRGMGGAAGAWAGQQGQQQGQQQQQPTAEATDWSWDDKLFIETSKQWRDESKADDADEAGEAALPIPSSHQPEIRSFHASRDINNTNGRTHSTERAMNEPRDRLSGSRSFDA